MYSPEKILVNVINFLAPVVALGLVIFLVIQSWKLVRGNSGTIKSLITGIIFFIFIIGVMFAAGSFRTYGNMFQGLFQKGVEHIERDVNSIINQGE